VKVSSFFLILCDGYTFSLNDRFVQVKKAKELGAEADAKRAGATV
jgi:hypothetical protein